MSGDYIAFGDLVLNGDGAVGPTGATYTVTRAEGLGGLPRPRITITQLAGYPGAVLGEADDDIRIVILEGEIHAPTHALLEEELSRFKYHISPQRGAQWLYWTPEGRAARKILAVLQNDGAVALDANDDTTATFRLEFLCPTPYWQATTDTVVTSNITSSGQTLSITNVGDVYSEPVIQIKPTSVKTGGYAYKRWVAVWNRTSSQLNNYPLEITSQAGTGGLDHAALVLAGKSQADGDDLRVQVDGVEVDRWLDGVNTANCKIWVNLTLQPRASATLSESFTSGDSISSLTVDDVSGFPTSGILYNVNSGEAFTYTGVDTATNRFTGVTRAAKGTTAAAGSVGDEIVWIEHDIWILYGNSSVSAPSVDDDYKPAFNLSTSTNTSWDYDDFGETDGLRTAQWSKLSSGTGVPYTADHATNADPWEEAGILVGIAADDFGTVRWKLFCPVGMTAVSFSNGEKRADSDVSYWTMATMQIQESNDGSSWSTLYTVPSPSAADTWESWSWSGSASGKWISLYGASTVKALPESDVYLEVADVTVTLDSSNTPGIILGSEQGNYSLDATLTIVEDGTDGDAIRLQATIALNETLEVDCEERTVTYLKDNSNQFQALSLQEPVNRNWWIRLPGHWDGGKTVQLRYDEDGVTGVELTVTFAARYL